MLATFLAVQLLPRQLTMLATFLAVQLLPKQL
jgi:hypothetical protein